MDHPKYAKGFKFAQKHIEKFGAEKTKETMEMVFAINKGRPADDPYIAGVRAALQAEGA